MSIHPSAIVAAGALVPASCTVGPFCTIGPEVVLGSAGFAEDTAPEGALVCLPGGGGSPVVAPSLAEARQQAAAAFPHLSRAIP